MIRPPGTSIPMVSITVARLPQAGIGEARRNVCSVWSVPLRDLAPALVALGLAGLAAAAPLGGGAQACREPHYRWTQKTDTALADVAPQPTSVAVILATWAPPRLGPRDRCAPRSDHELETYSVTAWVRAGISGAAFFDGQHRRGGRRSEQIDGAHGRCNSSVRALWEIHPVYRVTSP